MVDTAFWTDPYIQKLAPDLKLVFLYLLTNPLTNICGVYEVTDKQIAFDTGFSEDVIRSVFHRFETDGRCRRSGDWVAMRNWLKHQTNAPGVQEGIKRQLTQVPSDLADYVTGGFNPRSTPVQPTPNSTEPNPTELEVERPPHQLLALAWFKAYSAKTLRLVAPGTVEYLKAETLCARMDPKIAESTIAPYFSGDWWFTKDKNTKKPNYSFGGWVAHVTDILAAGPVKAKAKGWKCPNCGALNTHTGQVCMECKEGREGA